MKKVLIFQKKYTVLERCQNILRKTLENKKV
jgi:hypothetical protein